jgi:hypothetical protein
MVSRPSLPFGVHHCEVLARARIGRSGLIGGDEPGFMRSSIAACTSAGGLIRSTTEALGFAAFLPVL